MMSRAYRRFEDLLVWQKARALASAIYLFTGEPPVCRDFELRDQMRAAAVSIASNIAEGFERGTDPQFIQFLYHSRGSCGELRTQLYIALDNHAIDEGRVRVLFEQAEEVSKMLYGLIKSLGK